MKNLKKAIALLLSVVMLFSFMAVGTMASAETVEGNYAYKVVGGEAIITGVNTYELMGEVVIPSKLGGYPVTAIYDYAFENCSYATSIVIPDSVKSVGYEAFSDCTAIKSIDLGNGLTNFPFEILEYADNLEEITIGKSVRITADEAYYFFNLYDSYETLTKITVSKENPYLDAVDGVLYGENMAYLLYYPLSSTAASYTMPATVKGVFYPLYLAKNLQKISYNDKFSLMDDCISSYEMIECLDNVSIDAVFMTEMMSYIIPVNVAEITVNAAHPHLTAEDNVLYNKDKSIIVRYAANRANNVFEIASDVEWMATEALSGARNLELTISDGFTKNLEGLIKEVGGEVNVADAVGQLLSSSAAKKFIVADTNKYLKVDNGVLYNKNMTDLIKYPIDSYGNYYELPATVKIENLIDEYNWNTGAFASLAGASLSVYPEYITASELTVHVSDATLEAAMKAEAYEVVAVAFLGVDQVCTDNTSAELKAYNKLIDELIDIVEEIETEYESLETMLGLYESLYADLEDETVNTKTAVIKFVNNAYDAGTMDKADRDEILAELNNVSAEEFAVIEDMLPVAVAEYIDEIEAMLYNPETTTEMGLMTAMCVKMAVCGGEHLYEIVWRNAPVTIKTPSVSEIDYGETLVLHAEYEAIPEGAKFVWTVTGEGVEIVPSEDGTTCAVISTDKGTATVKLSVVAENGKAVVDENGVELGSEQVIKSNSNLWLKIVSFFKNLFGMNRTIEQSIIIR